MNGIVLESGVNDCNFNINGRCTNQVITRGSIPASFSRDWDSEQNCVYTQLGISLCDGYLQESCVNINKQKLSVIALLIDMRDYFKPRTCSIDMLIYNRINEVLAQLHAHS